MVIIREIKTEEQKQREATEKYKLNRDIAILAFIPLLLIFILLLWASGELEAFMCISPFLVLMLWIMRWG